MRPGIFRQEEFFERYEFACRYMLALSGAEPLTHGQLRETVGEAAPADLDLGYTPSAGDPELRKEIASGYTGAAGDNVIVTVGAIEALLIVAHLLLRNGDEAVCLWPSYQPLYELPRTAGARVRFVELAERDGFQIDLDRLLAAVTPRTRLVIVNTPHNPTGATVRAADLRDFAAGLERIGVYLLVDEIFREMWPDHGPSVWNGMANIIVVSGLSKAYGLPGFRIGWLLAPAGLAVEARRFRKYTSLNPGVLDQAWALRALRRRDVILARTHSLVSDGLSLATEWLAERPEIFSVVPPTGGGLLFPRLRLKVPTNQFCSRLVEETGVLLAPGSDCYNAEGFLRLGFASSQLRPGLERLAEYLEA